MAVITTLLTVDEFARLPQPAGGIRQELHHGELFELPPVKSIYTKVQKRLVKLLDTLLNPSEQGVDKEFPFRPAAEYEVWVVRADGYSKVHDATCVIQSVVLNRSIDVSEVFA